MPEGVTAGITLLANRYEIGDVIGRGGMATVHVGNDTRLGRKVAVKLLKPSLANDPSFRIRFRQEAQRPHACAPDDRPRLRRRRRDRRRAPPAPRCRSPTSSWSTSRAVRSPTSSPTGPSPRTRRSASPRGILTALEYSHRAGVVHRDIKPANVMVTNTGQVKVMDFGIARAITDTSATVAQTTSILGTASYFSPEQARGETVDARTDIYSTGVVLFELLTGRRPPFVGDSPVAVAYQHVSEQPVAPSTISADVSPALGRGDPARPGEGPHAPLPERCRVPVRPAAGGAGQGADVDPEAGPERRERRVDDALRRQPARTTSNPARSPSASSTTTRRSTARSARRTVRRSRGSGSASS